MSNHSGSYMLNGVLKTAKEMGILETIGEDKSLEFARKLVELGRGYDCNTGEILEDIGEDLSLCYYCLEKSKDLEYGLCENCR